MFLQNVANLCHQSKRFLETSFFFDESDSKDAFAHKWPWHIS